MLQLCAFADEAGSSLVEQIAALRRNRIPNLELRSIDGKNVLDFTEDEARAYAKARYDAAGVEVTANSRLTAPQIRQFCPMDDAAQTLLRGAFERMGLSARACSRIIKLARTIADLAGVPDILPEHISEAAGYRFLDKQNVFA